MSRIAVLSNVNVSPITRLLSRDEGLQLWEPEGYGDIFGSLLNPASDYAAFGPDLTIVLVDANQLFAGASSTDEALSEIDMFFSNIAAAPSNSQLFISDLSFRNSVFADDYQTLSTHILADRWNAKLLELSKSGAGVYCFEYAELVEAIGKDAFYTDKMWYLGRIPHTVKAQQAIADRIRRIESVVLQPRKKVLFVDLDNTLWGGVVGELGATGIELSDEHNGLIYKDIQRELLRIKNAGVVLGIVSKNNPDDALEAIRENSHMVLKEDDFSITYLNWERKDANISNAAEVLNLGMDSFVFLDDNPTERELVSTMLPEVTVLPFPDEVSEVPSMLREAYELYFRPTVITREAQEKTEQYAAMAKSAALQQSSSSFEEYLSALEMTVSLVSPADNIDRLTEMIAKTNQFNLTTKRYTRSEIAKMIESPDDYRVYAFEVVDRFANNGITSLAIVRLSPEPVIDEFLMSCRVMGRCIENYIVDYIERDMMELGAGTLKAEYVPTKKNVPVQTLYQDLGYRLVEQNGDEHVFEIDLNARPERVYQVSEG